MLACCAEHLTEHRINEDRSLPAQANWLAVQIDESRDLDHVLRLAGIGLDLASPHLEDDDMLGNELCFLFDEIVNEALKIQREKRRDH